MPQLSQAVQAFAGMPGTVSKSPAELSWQAQWSLPCNTMILACKADDIIDRMIPQHDNDFLIPGLQRDANRVMDLSWLLFGGDTGLQSFPKGQVMQYTFDAETKVQALRVLAALRGGAGVPEMDQRLAMALALSVLQGITENNLVYPVLMCHSFMCRTKLKWVNQQDT